MEALVLYMTFHYFVNTILTQWGGVFGVNMNVEVGGTSGLAMIASIKTLDMGMVGALAVSGIVIYLHNRFFDTELPEWLGSFSGSTFVFMIGFFVMIPVAVLACTFWPKVQLGITASLKSFCPEAGFTASGFAKMFGCLGAALAFYSTAKPEKKKKSFSERYFRKYRSSNFCWNLYVCDVTIKIIVI